MLNPVFSAAHMRLLLPTFYRITGKVHRLSGDFAQMECLIMVPVHISFVMQSAPKYGRAPKKWT